MKNILIPFHTNATIKSQQCALKRSYGTCKITGMKFVYESCKQCNDEWLEPDFVHVQW